MASALEEALGTLVNVFHQYALRAGDKNTLNKRELKELIQNEMTIGPKLNESKIKNMMEDLDQNKDQEVNFQEYTVFLAAMAKVYNDA